MWQSGGGGFVLRAIHLFPRFINEQLIHEMRARYDPLFNLIPPHITLVFPFESDLSARDIDEHVQEVVTLFSPFSIMLQGITAFELRYLFLNVKIGNDAILALHDGLYSGILESFLKREFTYVPHITVGQFENEEECMRVLRETEQFTHRFESKVGEIVIERIADSGVSEIESFVALRYSDN